MDVDCWHMVLSLVDVADVPNVALTCRLFAAICRSASFYLRLFERLLPDFLSRNHCTEEPLLTGLEDVPPDVDCTCVASYFRFLWQNRLERTRLSGLYDAHYGLHGKEYVYVEQRGYSLAAIKGLAAVLRSFLCLVTLVVSFSDWRSQRAARQGHVGGESRRVS